MGPKITQAAARAAKAKATAKAKAKARPTMQVIEGQFPNPAEWQYMVRWGNMEAREYAGGLAALVLTPGPDTYFAKLSLDGVMQVRRDAGRECTAPVLMKSYVSFGGLIEVSGTPREQREILLVGPLEGNEAVVSAIDTRVAVNEPVMAVIEGGRAEWTQLQLMMIPLPFLLALNEFGDP